MTTSNQIHSAQTLNPTGHLLNGMLSGISAVAVLQPGYAVQTYASTGKGLPPLNSLYRGFIANAACDVSGQALTFFFYGMLSKQLTQPGQKLSKEQETLTGLVAGAGASPAIAAWERVMILQQLNGGSITQVARNIIAQEGGMGMLKGTTPTIAREALCAATVFGFSDMLADQIKVSIPHDLASKTIASLVTGSLVGAITTPCNNIKTLMQEEIGPSQMLKTGKTLVQKQGTKGLFRGVAPRSVLIGALTMILVQIKDNMPVYYPDFLHE